MGEICKQKEPDFETIKEACRYLNPFYIDSRYPVHGPLIKDTATQAREAIEKIRDYVIKTLGF